MKPTLWLRIAAGLALFNAVGHTIGQLSTPTDTEALSAVQAMQAHRFEVMGSTRTYWDFFTGFSVFITITVLLVAVLCWQLASLAKSAPRMARPMIAALAIAYVGYSVLGWLYLFAAPELNIAATAACLLMALAGVRQGTA